LIRIGASKKCTRRIFEDVVQTDQLRVCCDEKFRAFSESSRDVKRVGGADPAMLKFKIAALGSYDESRKID
jgi:hypothetical protein